MIDKLPHEEAAIAAVLPLLGECVAEIGKDKPLSAYSRSEVLTLVEVVATAYQDALLRLKTQEGCPF